MSQFNISKQQTHYIKGIGILLIVLHNYFHWIAPFTGENEFVFDVQYTQNLLSALGNSYSEIPNTLLSFFGHYGVQLFIFISGYGLAKSFTKHKVTFIAFIKKRMVKLYPAFFIAIGVLLLYNFLLLSYTPTKEYTAKLVLKLTMLHTLVPRQALSISGPWWFYGVIFQLYILFIPLYVLLKKWQWLGFIFILGISYAAVVTLYNPLLSLDIFIMANFPGHLPEFAFGILLALSPQFKWKWYWVIFSLLVFVAGNFYFLLFPLTFISITYFLVWLLTKIRTTDSIFSKLVIFYGKLSMFLFAIHACFRKPYFINTAKNLDNALEKIAIAFLYLLVVTAIAYICQEGYAGFRKLLQKTK